MAYSSQITAALTGATLRQLAHWRRSDLLVPEVSTSRPIQYSYRDLIAVRTFVFLRRGKSLQAIRQAVANLRDLGELEHISAYRLMEEGKSIVLVKGRPGTRRRGVDLLDKPGQRTIAVMADVLAEFPKANGQIVPDLTRPRRLVSVNPKMRGGFPVIDGTRVPFDVIASLVRDGVPTDEVSSFYPSVSAAAAADAADFGDYVESFRSRPLAS